MLSLILGDNLVHSEVRLKYKDHYREVRMEIPGIIGPTKGFSPQIGVLVSMMAFIRSQVLNCVTPMSTQDLDFLMDAKANTIGATLVHLAATETYYQLNTFDGMKWGSWPDNIREKWDVPMNLGDAARKTIKGNSLDYYLTMLHETREKTLAEFRERDDEWLAIVDEEWKWNNHAKWFHVTEHESNHNGQFKFLRSRFPGAKPAGG
jgi:hypothetical protein